MWKINRKSRTKKKRDNKRKNLSRIRWFKKSICDRALRGNWSKNENIRLHRLISKKGY